VRPRRPGRHRQRARRRAAYRPDPPRARHPAPARRHPARAGLLVGSPALLDGILGVGLGVVGAWVATRLALGGDVPWTDLAVELGRLGLALPWPLRCGRWGASCAPVAGRSCPTRPTRSPRPPAAGPAPGPGLRLPRSHPRSCFICPPATATTWSSSPRASRRLGRLRRAPRPAFGWPGLALVLWRITAGGLNAAGAARRATRTAGWRPAGRHAAPAPPADRAGRQPGWGWRSQSRYPSVSSRRRTTKQARLDVALRWARTRRDRPARHGQPRPGPGEGRRCPRVRHVEPMLHRLTYVGPDLQDLLRRARPHGRQAAPMLDAFTPGSSARTAMAHSRPLRTARWCRRRRCTTTSCATVTSSGSGCGTPRGVPGRAVPCPRPVTEFATAPRDSFVVANFDYVGRATGAPTPRPTRAHGPPRRGRRRATHEFSAADAKVADTSTETATVTTASGLAATDLSGLARLGVGFGVLLAWQRRAHPCRRRDGAGPVPGGARGSRRDLATTILVPAIRGPGTCRGRAHRWPGDRAWSWRSSWSRSSRHI